VRASVQHFDVQDVLYLQLRLAWLHLFYRGLQCYLGDAHRLAHVSQFCLVLDHAQLWQQKLGGLGAAMGRDLLQAAQFQDTHVHVLHPYRLAGELQIGPGAQEGRFVALFVGVGIEIDAVKDHLFSVRSLQRGQDDGRPALDGKESHRRPLAEAHRQPGKVGEVGSWHQSQVVHFIQL